MKFTLENTIITYTVAVDIFIHYVFLLDIDYTNLNLNHAFILKNHSSSYYILYLYLYNRSVFSLMDIQNLSIIIDHTI